MVLYRWVLSQWLLEVNRNEWHFVGAHRMNLYERESDEMNIILEGTRLSHEEGKWVLSAFVRLLSIFHYKVTSPLALFTTKSCAYKLSSIYHWLLHSELFIWYILSSFRITQLPSLSSFIASCILFFLVCRCFLLCCHHLLYPPSMN